MACLGRRLFASHSARRHRRERTNRREPRHDFRSRFAARGDPSPVSARRVDFDDGSEPARAAKAAAQGRCGHSFRRPIDDRKRRRPEPGVAGTNKTSLVEAVTRANPRTVVVLETGGPVPMPWLEQTAAVLEAWYPGNGRRGDRRNPLRRRQPFRTPAGHLPGQRRSIASSEDSGRPERRADRACRARRTLRRNVYRYCTMKARRSAINGSLSARDSRCFRSASGSHTPASL